MKSVAYASFCCAKDIDRAMATCHEHANSHAFPFQEKLMVFQRCGLGAPKPEGFRSIIINDADYPELMKAFDIEYPNPALDELTHGWGAPHFWAHHIVNHLKSGLYANSEYIVFADGDCHMKSQPEGQSWIDAGIQILEDHPDIFVISPNEGGPERKESIMSQQMFLVKRMQFLEMEFIPWDGKFIIGGPFQEYYGLLEGFIGRYMEKNDLFRYVLPPEFRYWHEEWH